VWATVTSHVALRPDCHGTSVKPSGRSIINHTQCVDVNNIYDDVDDDDDDVFPVAAARAWNSLPSETAAEDSTVQDILRRTLMFTVALS